MASDAVTVDDASKWWLLLLEWVGMVAVATAMSL